jgi:RNA polymerase sigma factor (sigma-70 family)
MVAREILIKANIPLVIFVAKKYQNMGLTLPELVQSGFPGLLKAVERYNPDSGNRFGTFATWWIRQTIGREVANTGRAIRLPVNRGMMVNRIFRSSRDLAPLDSQNDLDELSDRVGLPAASVQNLLESAQIGVSLDSPYIGQTENESRGWDEVIKDPSPTLEDVAMDKIMVDKIKALILLLPDVEAEVMILYFGLNGGLPLPLRGVASKMNMSPEGVRQARDRALSKVRGNLNGN